MGSTRGMKSIGQGWLAALALCAAMAASACATRVAPPMGPSYASSAAMAAGQAARVERGERRLQCVPYARDHSGIAIYGDAGEWWEKAAGRYARSKRPVPGAVLVLQGYTDRSSGHVAVVRHVLDSRAVVVDHANWLNGGEINLGTPVLDVSPDNDWSAVRVWYTPSRQFGRRVYTARGFIYPIPDTYAAR